MTEEEPTHSIIDCHTNNGQGYNVLREGIDGTVEERTVKYIPRLMVEEKNALIVAYIRGQLSLDEFRIRIKKSRRQAFRIIREFKDGAEYVNLQDDEWDRMTFSKEFNESVPIVERYRALTTLKKQRMMTASIVNANGGKEVVLKWRGVDLFKDNSLSKDELVSTSKNGQETKE